METDYSNQSKPLSNLTDTNRTVPFTGPAPDKHRVLHTAILTILIVLIFGAGIGLGYNMQMGNNASKQHQSNSGSNLLKNSSQLSPTPFPTPMIKLILETKEIDSGLYKSWNIFKDNLSEKSKFEIRLPSTWEVAGTCAYLKAPIEECDGAQYLFLRRKKSPDGQNTIKLAFDNMGTYGLCVKDPNPQKIVEEFKFDKYEYIKFLENIAHSYSHHYESEGKKSYSQDILVPRNNFCWVIMLENIDEEFRSEAEGIAYSAKFH